MRAVRSYMAWNQVPEFESSASLKDGNLFAGPRTSQPVKSLSNYHLMTGFAKKLERLTTLSTDTN